MRESAMPIMLTGLRGVVRGAWWDVPAARQGVILLDQLSPPLPTLESASQELSLYLQSAGLAVLRVFGSPGAGDLDACALLAAVEALRARRIERIAPAGDYGASAHAL